MKQYLHAFSILFFSALFVFSALGMSYGAISGMQESFTLSAALSVAFLGPISLAALAIVASSMKAGFDEKNYKEMKPIIIVLAAIQLALMATYLILIWRGE